MLLALSRVIYSNCFHHAPICKLWKRKRSAERDMKETTTLQSCYCFIIIINPLKHSFHTCMIKILISFLLFHTALVFQQKPVSLVRFTKTIRNGKWQITCSLWNFREIQQFQQALFTNEHKYCCWLIHARMCPTQTTTRSSMCIYCAHMKNEWREDCNNELLFQVKTSKLAFPSWITNTNDLYVSYVHC